MYAAIRKGLFRIDAENAHGLAFAAGKVAQTTVAKLLARRFRVNSPRLRQSLLGLEFETPVGLAAGMDKNAELLGLWPALGFGFAEVGSVTARASLGNPKPRAFRLPADRALINRMGLNNEGAEHVARRLASMPPGSFPVGINIAKTHDPEIEGQQAVEDFATSFRLLAPHADFIAINVSCPNTREGKTFEDPKIFEQLMARLAEVRAEIAATAPILVKVSPPPPPPEAISSAIDELVDIALAHGVAGFIACNTASDRQGLMSTDAEIARIGRGGLSGAPLAQRSTRMIRHLYRRLGGRAPIIGVGGVSSLTTAVAKIEAGASLIELYSGLVYEGPGLASRLAGQLDDWLASAGYSHISEAVGSSAGDE